MARINKLYNRTVYLPLSQLLVLTSIGFLMMLMDSYLLASFMVMSTVNVLPSSYGSFLNDGCDILTPAQTGKERVQLI